MVFHFQELGKKWHIGACFTNKFGDTSQNTKSVTYLMLTNYYSAPFCLSSFSSSLHTFTVKLSYQLGSNVQTTKQLWISDTILGKWRREFNEYGENLCKRKGTNSVTELAGIDAPEEEMFRRRMQRKKKKGKRM